MKACSKCNFEKELNEFPKRKSSKDGYRPCCKKCVAIQIKEYCESNKESISKNKKEYYSKNKKAILDSRKKDYERVREIRIDNKEERNLYIREWRKRNKERISNKIKEKKKSDNLYKLLDSIRTLIWISIKRMGYDKNLKTQKILGCSFDEFKFHIESQFKEGMCWENHGKWHLDHIIPISSSKSEEEVYKLNHYKNFQPLWAFENLSKGNKIITINEEAQN